MVHIRTKKNDYKISEWNTCIQRILRGNAVGDRFMKSAAIHLKQ